jgi:hypothetical protein
MTEAKDISLVVLSHGLWGVKSHMSYIEKKLVEKYGETIHIVRFPFSLLAFQTMILIGIRSK